MSKNDKNAEKNANRRAMFDSYRAIEARKVEALGLVAEIDAELGAACDEIVKAHGKGPFKSGDTLLKARKQKDGPHVFVALDVSGAEEV